MAGKALGIGDEHGWPGGQGMAQGVDLGAGRGRGAGLVGNKQGIPGDLRPVEAKAAFAVV